MNCCVTPMMRTAKRKDDLQYIVTSCQQPLLASIEKRLFRRGCELNKEQIKESLDKIIGIYRSLNR